MPTSAIENTLPENDRLIVGPSPSVAGELGVIARRSFNRGEVLCLVKGSVHPSASKYSFAIDIDQHIEPRDNDEAPNFGRFMNHSCDPSAYMRTRKPARETPSIEIIARKALQAGDEITFDYATLEFAVTVTGMRCSCRTLECRGTIYGFNELPEQIVERYKAEGILSEYLLQYTIPD
jgi:hypothetical protein